MEPDLSHSITMHPHIFQTQSRASLHHGRILSTARAATPSQTPPGRNAPTASSTGVDAVNSEDDAALARHPSTAATDVEVESQMAGRLPLTAAENDPYGLSQRYKSEAELEEIKANMSRKRNSRRSDASYIGRGGRCGHKRIDSLGIQGGSKGKLVSMIPSFGYGALQVRRLESFYQAQNETIERLLKSVEQHRAEARQEEGDNQLKYQIAVWGSFVANLVLAALQIYGAVSSGSLSLFTTMADAIFDPLSNLTLILTNRAVKTVDPSRFPSGKARLETVGNIAFCFLMTAVSFILVAFSVKDLTENHEAVLNKFHLPSVVAVAVAFTTKLLLFLYTWSIKDKYSQVSILWQDHRNDLLINGFGIMTSVLGAKLIWSVDPAGAIVLSIIVSAMWLRTAFAEFLLLVGVVASIEVQQLITYICVTHSPAVRQIDTVRVYHAGPRLIAEVDVVMDPDATLVATHDVAEELQFKLESLPDVERAYVHVDYETTHKPEHAYKKDL